MKYQIFIYFFPHAFLDFLTRCKRIRFAQSAFCCNRMSLHNDTQIIWNLHDNFRHAIYYECMALILDALYGLEDLRELENEVEEDVEEIETKKGSMNEIIYIFIQ